MTAGNNKGTYWVNNRKTRLHLQCVYNLVTKELDKRSGTSQGYTYMMMMMMMMMMITLLPYTCT